MTPRQTLVLDLLVSILGVAGWSPERVYALRDKFAAEELHDPVVLPALSEEEIAQRLCRAGYDRGAYIIGLMTERVIALGKAIDGAGIDRARLGTQRPRRAFEVVQWIKGVGPSVIRNFKALRWDAI